MTERSNEALLSDLASAVWRAEKRENRCDGSDKDIKLCEEATAEVVQIRAAVLARMSSGWQPMSSAESYKAEKNEIMLWWPMWGKGVPLPGWWDRNREAKTPRPFWATRGFDIKTLRAFQPTAWQPLPAPPSPSTSQEGNAP